MPTVFEFSLWLNPEVCLYINHDCIIPADIQFTVYYNPSLTLMSLKYVKIQNLEITSVTMEHYSSHKLRALWKDNKMWEEFSHICFLQMLNYTLRPAGVIHVSLVKG